MLMCLFSCCTVSLVYKNFIPAFILQVALKLQHGSSPIVSVLSSLFIYRWRQLNNITNKRWIFCRMFHKGSDMDYGLALFSLLKFAVLGDWEKLVWFYIFLLVNKTHEKDQNRQCGSPTLKTFWLPCLPSCLRPKHSGSYWRHTVNLLTRTENGTFVANYFQPLIKKH